MYRICVFAGTTEGRRLAEFLRGQAVQALFCVATEYGGALIPAGENVEVAAGRLDAEGMAALLRERRFDMAIDATHPFAEEVSKNLAAACAETGTACLRLLRDDVAPDGDAVVVPSIEAAADFLASHPGRALIATGGKDLMPYAAVTDGRERFFVRVLPTAASLAACEAAGFSPAHIIAMQGPFTAEMNAATLRAVGADWLVTKASGDSGGLREKLAAAKQAGARCLVVGRPAQAEGLDFAGIVRVLIERFGLRDVREIDLVGVGMGGRDALTLEAVHALERADCVIGAARMLASVERFGKPAFNAYAPEVIASVIEAHPEYRRVAVALSGDPGFYSGAKRLMPLLSGHRVRVVPGVSSLQALCARLGTGWEDVKAVSLHGREGGVAGEVRAHGRVFALLGDEGGLRRASAELCAAGMQDAKIAVGERLSYPDETVRTGTAVEFADAACDPLAAMLIERPAENCPLPVGLPDAAFVCGTGEGGAIPMTKAEVRAVSVSKLRLTPDAVVWDVGAGTGSVSVEAALLCPRGRVFAVERRADAAKLIEKNAAKFAAGNIEVIPAEAPAALEGLPAPSHVFIGGSGGALRSIVAAALKANPRVRIVVNAIAPESVGTVAALAGEFGFTDHELIQLTVARARAAGRVHLMDGMNPVWIAAMQRGEEAGDEG